MIYVQEYVILVDQNDKMIGKEEKLKAHQLALLHRAFSVFIYRMNNKKIEFLLQQRHIDKYHCGGLWTNACCSHPRVGEDIIAAGQRRLQEELSLRIELHSAGAFQYMAPFDNGLTEHEFDHVLLGEYDSLQSISMMINEVQDIQWIEKDTLLLELTQHPEKFTPWLKPALEIALEKLCYLF